MSPALPSYFFAALNAVGAPILVHAGDRILHANAALLRLLGYELAALQSMQFDAWASPQTRQALRDYGLRALHETGELPAAEAEAMTASGSLRYLELNAKAVALEGCGLLVVMTFQDLSDMRHVQSSLLDLSRVLHQIIENNPVATFVLDAEHRVTHWNAACSQLTGIPMSDLMLGEREAWQAFYKEKRPLLADLILSRGSLSEAADDELQDARELTSQLLPGAFEVERFFPHMGAQGRWLFLTAAPLMDAQGQIMGAIETLQDVTSRRLAEEELATHRRELERLVTDRTMELQGKHKELEAFLENASVGIITTANQSISRSNRHFAEMFELGDEAPLGLPSVEFFVDSNAYEELGRIAYPVLSRGESLQHEMEMRTRKGNLIWVQMIAYVADPANPAAGTWWLLQDRTEVKRVEGELKGNFERIKETNARLEEAQNQLLQSEKMASIGQLAAGVAHEINNPIGFVSSNLATLRRYVGQLFQLVEHYESSHRSNPDAAKQAGIDGLRADLDMDFLVEDLPQLLNESEEGLDRVKKIVQDLKDFSRVDQTDWQDADLNAGLESTLNVVMNEVKYKAEVIKQFGPLPRVHCRAAQLNQVFMNLIVNAAHAISERGVITLSTRQEGEWVCVSVRDSGTGMSEAVMRRIFEPFYTTKPVGKGTGLGLSLSFSIVKRHGGRIEVESQAGMGSCFKVWLPIVGPAEPEAS
ncbi:PAS domain S-box protein [Roseateles sp.]|uniref:PAS domain S-box protein n=1 Tax=Roseateles sp. TaxID=1971397 RepID=UPI00286C0BAF|nr:PAS domain S-box protein [Roseateles sp.]